MVACALLRNVYPLRNGWSRNGWSQVLLSNKETLFSKRNCSLQLITITYKEKMFLRNNYSSLSTLIYYSNYSTQSFLMSLYL